MSGYLELRDLGAVFRPFDSTPPPLGGRRSMFLAAWGKTVRLLARELELLDAETIVCELDLRERDVRLDGMPRADARLATPAVRLSFASKWGPLRYETGEFTHWQDNVRAVALSMEALRAVDRYGVSKRGEQYRGWRAIPMHLVDPADALATREQAEQFLEQWGGDVRAALRATHPDRGGDEVEFRKVVRAKELVS